MFGSIFTVLLIQPVFNVLVFIYGILPGHNFGLAVIIFTVLVRLILWPLLKKQLHQSIKMRALQPELKKIKQQTKGNRQKQQMLMMDLYKQKGINPFGAIGVMLLQAPILIALYVGLRKIIDDPKQVYDFAYSSIQNLPSIHDLSINIHMFDNTLFGLIDLSKTAVSSAGTYWPAFILIVGAALVQFFQSRQLMPTDQSARKLRTIMKEASTSGKQADQAEVSAALSKSMIYVFPFMIFLIGMSLPAALSLYWFVSSGVALIQQSIILRRDSEELAKKASAPIGKKAKISKSNLDKDVNQTNEPSKDMRNQTTVTIKMNGKVISKRVDNGPAQTNISNETLKKPQNTKSKKSKNSVNKSKKRRKN